VIPLSELEAVGSFLTFPDPPYIVEMLLGLVGKSLSREMEHYILRLMLTRYQRNWRIIISGTTLTTASRIKR
jgi:hypothetical protein